MRQHAAWTLVIVGLIAAWAFGLGADHPKGPVKQDKWPAGLEALVNADNRVHGYFVNWSDMFFFSGDTAALNQFLVKYAALEKTKLELVIHPGSLDVKSPWDQQPRDIVANWTLYATPFEREQVTPQGVTPGDFVTRVDLWLGTSIRLSELQVPANIKVRSGGEIEKFVADHPGPTTAPAISRAE